MNLALNLNRKRYYSMKMWRIFVNSFIYFIASNINWCIFQFFCSFNQNRRICLLRNVIVLWQTVNVPNEWALFTGMYEQICSPSLSLVLAVRSSNLMTFRCCFVLILLVHWILPTSISSPPQEQAIHIQFQQIPLIRLFLFFLLESIKLGEQIKCSRHFIHCRF